MENRIPILKLSTPEKIWMKEVHGRNILGQRFSIRDIWSVLHDQLPGDFRPAAMDPRLISSGGENVRLLGIVALQGDYTILEKADQVLTWLREQLLAAPETSVFPTDIIAQGTALNKEDVHIVLQTITEFGQFYRTAKFDGGTLFTAGIDIGNEDAIFYKYVSFKGIRPLIESQKYSRHHQPADPFTFEEMRKADENLNAILEEIQKLKAGQEVIWTDIRQDIEELKALYSLGKKTWRQLLIGKVAEMVASGIVSDTLSKTIEDMFKSEVSTFLPWS